MSEKLIKPLPETPIYNYSGASVVSKALNSLNVELAVAEDARAVAEQFLKFADKLWNWDSMAFALRRSKSSPHYRPILVIDTINEQKVVCEENDYKISMTSPIISYLLMGKPCLINRTEIEIESNPLVRFGNTNRVSASLMFAPVYLKNNLMALITVQSYTPETFTEANLQELKAAADAIAPTLLRLRTENRMREFLSLGEKLNQQTDPPGVARVVAATTADLLSWDFISIHLFDPATNKLNLTMGLKKGDKRDYWAITSQVTEGSIIHEALNGAGLLIETDLLNENALASLEPFGTELPVMNSMIMVPIKSRDSIIGLICIQHLAAAAYGQEELELARAVADYCGGALDRARTKLNLKMSEDSYRMVVQNVNDGIVISQRGRFIFFNQPFASMLGYSSDELWELTYEEILSERGLEILENRNNMRQQGKEAPNRYNSEIKHRDGSEIPVELSISVIEDLNGGMATFAVIRDISDAFAAEANRRQSTEELQTLFHAMIDIVLVIDRDGRYVIHDSEDNRLLFTPVKHLAGKTIFDVFEQDKAQYFLELIHKSLDNQQTYTAEYDHEVAPGIFRWYNSTISPLSSSRVLMVARDVTERRNSEIALKRSEQRYALAVQGANDAIWDWNLETNRMYFSPRWWSIIGEHRDCDADCLADVWLDRVHVEDILRLQSKVDDHVAGRTAHLEDEHRLRHSDGTYRWVLFRGICVRDETDKAYQMAGSFTDITDRKITEEKLQFNASHDVLTSLPNREYFLANLEKTMARSRRHTEFTYYFAVLFLDLDRFKVVNDSLGHLAGDELIVATARRLETCVRPGDTVARLGGDEFTILLDGLANKSDALKIAERIIRDVGAPLTIGDMLVQTTVSIGIAFDRDSYTVPDNLLRDADTAMYRAKAAGRNQYQVFDQEMHARVMEQLQWESDLRRAVAEQQFELYYQPIYNLPETRLMGFEALLRWHHPQNGMIAPGGFVSIAEETGLIIPIGWWILDQAARASKTWNENRPESDRLCVSVNLSPKQIHQEGVDNRIKFLVVNAGAQLTDIVFEITENILMENSSEIHNVLKSIRSCGCKIDLDDFGTGYSSLSYLQRYPIDRLKIDRSFIGDIATSEKDRQIVSAMLGLARGLGMEVTAEGVETREQFETLKQMECDHAQGFYFSKPVPFDKTLEIIASQDSILPSSQP